MAFKKAWVNKHVSTSNLFRTCVFGECLCTLNNTAFTISISILIVEINS